MYAYGEIIVVSPLSDSISKVIEVQAAEDYLRQGKIESVGELCPEGFKQKFKKGDTVLYDQMRCNKAFVDDKELHIIHVQNVIIKV